MAVPVNSEIQIHLGAGEMGSNNHLISNFLAKISATFSSYKKARRANKDFQQLHRLSNHELRDIGMCRGDIAHMVYDNPNG